MAAIKKIVNLLKQGEVGVVPTDTLYGIIGRALDKKAVARIYKLRKRNALKPFIVLISSVNELEKFSIKPDVFTIGVLKKVWPGKTSVVLPCSAKDFRYLHRGTDSLAFRLPKNDIIAKIVKQTGPLVAPSANLEGKMPAKTTEEAREYFGDKVDFYLDDGKKSSPPSTLIKIENDKVIVLRKGAVNINGN